MIQSLLLDEAEGGEDGRTGARKRLDDLLLRPFNEDDAKAYDAEIHGRKNVEAAMAAGMGADDDPHMARPVSHPARPGIPATPGVGGTPQFDPMSGIPHQGPIQRPAPGEPIAAPSSTPAPTPAPMTPAPR